MVVVMTERQLEICQEPCGQREYAPRPFAYWHK
jgi:hypothetical protein